MTSETRPDFTITDHALLRWLERVHSVDIPGFRALMQAEVETSIFKCTGQKPTVDDFAFVMDGDRVVTVLMPGWHKKKTYGFGGFVVPRAEAGF